MADQREQESCRKKNNGYRSTIIFETDSCYNFSNPGICGNERNACKSKNRVTYNDEIVGNLVAR